MNNDFKAARGASGMSLGKAAQACGIANVTYAQLREPNPGSFKLEELRGLYNAMSDTSKTILMKAVRDFICS